MSWKDNLIKIEPYVAGEQPAKRDFIKLNANENPYPPSPAVTRAIREFETASVKRYPDANATPLLRAIADYEGLKPENVFAGNGSDEVLSLCFRAFFNSDKPIIYPDITYSFYPVWCDVLRIPYETIPVDENFEINAADYRRPNGGVVIANPYAPTSIGRGLDFIRAVPLLAEYDNLVITRTFSKSRSMAGLRIGYALGNREVISAIFAAKDSMNSYPLDSVAIAAGVASIGDEAYFRATLAKVMQTRERLAGELRAMGFDVKNSSTNFLFAKHPERSARDILEYLKTRDIYVRYFNKKRIDDHLRITVGTDAETDALIAALKEYLA